MRRQSKTILITGGAGFIGSHLCDHYIGKGYTVICLDNFLTGSEDNVRHLLGNQRFECVKHDMTRPIHFLGAIDTIFHLASPASPVDYLRYPIKTLKVGSLGTHNTLGLAKDKKARYVLASTSEVYGDPQVHPQDESYWGHVNPIGPRGVYDEAKRFAEALSLAYQRTHRIHVRIARIFNTYGPRMRSNDGRVVPNFIQQAFLGESLTVYGDGRQTRSFCYISDLVRGLVSLRETNVSGPFNVGNPTEFTVNDLAKIIIKLTKSTSKLVLKKLPEDDPRMRCPDIRRAKKFLNWEPKVRLEDGLKKTIEYFKNV